jgi:hypothetical protein
MIRTPHNRAYEPVPEFLKAGAQHSDAKVVARVIDTCFEERYTR